MSLADPPAWNGPSDDPGDEQFGDVVTPTTLDEADGFDAVLLGEPFDGAVIGRRGAAEAPAAIRASLAGVKTHHFEAGAVADVGDLGDIRVDADTVAAAQRATEAETDRVHDTTALPVFMGGDNSLTVPNVRPLLDDGHAVGVVSFDAHLDCRAVDGDPTSGTPYRQLHDAGLDRLAVVGARHFETSTVYADYLRERDGRIVTAESVARDAHDAVNAALATLADVDRLYLSVDCDVLDATAAPGVSAPTPGGLSTRELFRLVRRVASDERLAGVEVVECAPPHDRDGLTVDAAARTVAHALAGAAGRTMTDEPDGRGDHP